MNWATTKSYWLQTIKSTNNTPADGMPYGPAPIAVAELPYNAIMASFVLVLGWVVSAAGAEPNISEPASAGAVCAAAVGVADRKSEKGSASAWCDGGDMSVNKPHTESDILKNVSTKWKAA